MTRPTARVLALLEILQRGGTRTVAELAERLGVDERTVRRYVAHLLDLEVPVRSIRGRYGGYELAPGFRMPPLMLTDDEVLAVLLGVLSAERAGLAIDDAGERAAAKIRRVLPAALARRLDALLETARITGPAREPEASPETRVMLTLAEAARDHRPVALEYTSRDGRTSTRTLHPYGIVAHAGRWYVTGDDSASGEVRTFRLDRVHHARVMTGEFTPPSGFDPEERVLSGLAAAPRGTPVSVRVEASAQHVRTRLPRGVAVVEPVPDSDGWVRVRLHAERLDWVPAALAGLDRPFVVEEPDALRDHVRDLARRLANSAGNPGAS
ncbi:helix-turn-helix transcriptional regulator [Actinomycetospora sp. CA-053990]|uniref:helix-turn-helix transcriptional regulator n=1 Tax=Actinomycetospora sp. CA-053990 TaxID=3239891 RepID=UPI003D8F2F9B